jgi:hypothetical protein
MWDVPRLLMTVAGLGMIVIGIRRKTMWDVAFGGCFIGSAVFGYLAKSNEMYSWFQLLFAVAPLALAVIRLTQKRKFA